LAITRDTLPSACTLDCPDGCSLEVGIEDGRVVSLQGTRENPLTDGVICAKVRRFARHLYCEERVMQPLGRVRGSAKGAPGGFLPLSWDEALDRIAARLRDTVESRGGEAILPVSYGGSNGLLTEGAVDRRLFRRLGASRLRRSLCAAPTSAANEAMYGCMPGVAFEDYEHASLIVVWGANPHSSGMHVVTHIRNAQKRGAMLAVVDPRRTKLAARADLHLGLRPGTDLPLALALIRHLFATDRADRPFLDEHTVGADALRERADPWTFARAARVCGLEEGDVRRLAELYASSAPAVVRCGWGLERNRNGGSAACAVLALPTVGGKLGVRGGGFTMSNSRAWSLADAANEPPANTRLVDINRLGRALDGEADPPVELLFVYDCNPLATVPDQGRVRRSLARDDLFTVVFDPVMTDTARYADVVLPATTFLEHWDLRKGYGALALQLSRPAIDPVGEARPNYAVFADLLRRLDLGKPDDPETPAELVESILRDLPDVRATLERDGIAFPPCGLRPIQLVDVTPRTPDGLIDLFPERLHLASPRGLYVFADDPPNERFPLTMISPSTERTISSTFGQLHPDITSAQVHPRDASDRDIREGEVVRLFNDQGEVRTTVHLTDDVRPGLVFLPKGLWSHNTLNGNTANTLAPDSFTDIAHGACFNDTRLEVGRWGPAPRG